MRSKQRDFNGVSFQSAIFGCEIGKSDKNPGFLPVYGIRTMMLTLVIPHMFLSI